MSWLRLSVLAITWALAGHALADETWPLSVTRGAGTDDCPDAAGLLARIEAIRKSPTRPDQPTYRITFERDDTELRARIAGEQAGAERVLTDPSADCAALAKATAVTLALLFDADAQALDAAAARAVEPVPEPAPRIETQEWVAAEDYKPEPIPWAVGFGAGALTGVVGPVGFAGLFELNYASGLWRGALGFAMAFGPAIDLAPGRVEQMVYGGTIAGCIAPLQHGAWRFDLCSGGWIGAAQGVAYGFDERRSVDRFWPSLAIDLRLARWPEPAWGAAS